MKRLISMMVGLVLGLSLSSGPAFAEGDLIERTAVVATDQSHDGQQSPGNPVTSLFSEIQRTLTQVPAPNPLRSLVNTIAAQLAALEPQLAQLYDDLFVETCPTCGSDSSGS